MRHIGAEWQHRNDLGGLVTCIRYWEQMNTMVRFKIFIEGSYLFNTGE